MSNDTKFYDNLVDQINGATECPDIQKLVASVIPDLSQQMAWVKQQVAAMAPIVELVQNPGADLEKLATWAGKVITHQFMPQYQAYLEMVEKITFLEQQFMRVMSALMAAAGRLESCILSMPSQIINGAEQGATGTT